MDYEKNMRNLLVPKSQNVGKNPKVIGLSSFNYDSLKRYDQNSRELLENVVTKINIV